MKQTSDTTETAGGAAPVDLHAEGREVWAAFQQLTSRMAGFEALKRCPEFAYLDGVEDGVNVYTYLPFLFTETFPSLGREVFGRLSLMSLLYVHHIIIADALLDDDKELPRESLLVSNACSLRALEVLTGLFGRRPFPWREVTELHQQYSLATALEKERAGGELPSYSFDDLMSRLSRKSAMAKLIPLALCSLSGRRKHLGALNDSFDLYYLSEQLVDDFRDWKDDLAAGRHSYLLTSVFKAFDLRPKIEGLDAGEAEQVVGKHMYLSGLAEGYLARAIEYCEQAKARVRGLACPRWLNFLNTFQLGIQVSQSNISKRSRRHLLRPERYEYLLAPAAEASDSPAPVRPRVPHPVASVSPTVSDAARRAAEFLRARYKPGVGFEDFLMARGQLSVWVGGYVGASLLEWARGAREGRERGAPLRQLLGRLAAGLKRKRREGGWAPSPYAPEDADTTAWVLNFLLAQGAAPRRLKEEAVASLLRYQREDGGFGTYLPGTLSAGAEGYTDSHTEVTAVALEVLLKAGLDPEGEAVRGGVKFIRERQGADGLWQAYWWDGRMFATYHCLRALKLAGASLDLRTREAIRASIFAEQDADGGWGRATVGKNEAFETALALGSLQTVNPSRVPPEGSKKAVAWLLNHQAADGGFNSGPMMRVPSKGDREPWNGRDWVLDSPGGFGTLSRDQNRLFTTSTVLSALADFLSLAGDHRPVAHFRTAPGRPVVAGQGAAARPATAVVGSEL